MTLWAAVAAILGTTSLASVAMLARTWRRRVGRRVFDLEATM